MNFLSLILIFIGLSMNISSIQPLNLRVNPHTNQLIDEYERLRIFHGFNLVKKSFPYHDNINDFYQNQNDLKYLKNAGFNVVRLGVMWPGVEPERGHFNHTYLNTIKHMIEEFGKAGVYTMIDFHQDLFSERFCGDGVPGWMVDMLYPLNTNCSTGIGPIASKLKLCKPFKEYNMTLDPKTKHPIKGCDQTLWTDYYMTPEVASAFEKLFNYEIATDHLLKYFDIVAQTFHDSKYVLGYDIFNEPFVGDVYNRPKLLRAGEADLVQLQPLYEKIHHVIRKYDTKKIIFYEANQFPGTFPILDGIVNYIGFTQVPGGKEYEDRSVLSYHIYCCASGYDACISGHDVDPKQNARCDSYVQRKFDQRIRDFKRIGGGGFLTEFGACSESEQCVMEINRNTRACDREFQSWAYWHYQHGFFHSNGTIKGMKMNALVRSYAQAIDGKPEEMIYYENTKEFELKYEANDQRNGITEIYTVQNSKERKINVKMGQVEISTSGEHIVLIKHPKGKKQKIHIEIISSTNSTSPTTLAPTQKEC